MSAALEQQEQLHDQFKGKAEALAAEVWRFPDLERAWTTLEGLLVARGVRRVVWPRPDLPGWQRIKPTGLELHFEENEVFQHVATAEAGVIRASLAVAETGSVLQVAESVSPRLASMLPPLVIVLLPTASLVADLEAAWNYLAALPQLPGYLSFISGPSRTADIERTLSLGVHGPGQLIIVFLDSIGVTEGEAFGEDEG